MKNSIDNIILINLKGSGGGGTFNGDYEKITPTIRQDISVTAYHFTIIFSKLYFIIYDNIVYA